jgi:hypothetical protein
LLDREQNKATEGFSGTGFFHKWQASVVQANKDRVSAFPVRATLQTHIPWEAHD